MITFAVEYINQVIMKKILFSLISLMAVMTMQAQSICSSWRCIQPEVNTAADETFTVALDTYTFYEDGTYSQVTEYTMSTEPAQTMALEIAGTIEIKGAYTLNGNQLTLNPDKNTYKAEVVSISQNGRVTNNASIKADAKRTLNGNQVKSHLTQNKTTTVNIGNAVMEMKDGGKTSNFARIATIKK